jgi:hypothetical protein
MEVVTMLGKLLKKLGLKKEKGVEVNHDTVGQPAESQIPTNIPLGGAVREPSIRRSKDPRDPVNQIQNLAEGIRDAWADFIEVHSEEEIQKLATDLAIIVSQGKPDIPSLSEVDRLILRVWMIFPAKCHWRLPDRSGFEAWSKIGSKIGGLWKDRVIVELIFPELSPLLGEVFGEERDTTTDGGAGNKPKWSQRAIFVSQVNGYSSGFAWPPILAFHRKPEVPTFPDDFPYESDEGLTASC